MKSPELREGVVVVLNPGYNYNSVSPDDFILFCLGMITQVTGEICLVRFANRTQKCEKSQLIPLLYFPGQQHLFTFSAILELHRDAIFAAALRVLLEKEKCLCDICAVMRAGTEEPQIPNLPISPPVSSK